jgi:hypothetical protein
MLVMVVVIHFSMMIMIVALIHFSVQFIDDDGGGDTF